MIQLPADLPYDDLVVLSSMLERAQLLVPGYVPPSVGRYSIDAYLFEHRILGVEFLILPDRNLASRIAKVGMGEPVDQNRRIAAALMAFAQCLNLNFEPSVAFHELAHHSGNAIAHEEYESFRAADAARPQEWIDVALQRVDRLAPPKNVRCLAQHDLAKPLWRWNRNYVMALKVAELELEGKPAVEKALRLLDWMYSDFIVGGPAFLFAALYFAPSAQPDHFGRVAIMSGHVRKIRILRYEHKAVVLGMLPNDAIVGLIEAKLPNRFGVGEQIREQRAEFEAEILIEQQLHAAIRTPRSRSAAYDKQARMSPSVSSG